MSKRRRMRGRTFTGQTSERLWIEPKYATGRVCVLGGYGEFGVESACHLTPHLARRAAQALLNAADAVEADQ